MVHEENPKIKEVDGRRVGARGRTAGARPRTHPRWHSAGSFTAQALALQHPERVSGPVLAGLLAVDHRGALHRIRVPTLIVWGDRDALFPLADQQALAAGIPAATLIVYQETGHAPHWERPDRLVRDLAQFMQGGAPR